MSGLNTLMALALVDRYDINEVSLSNNKVIKTNIDNYNKQIPQYIHSTIPVPSGTQPYPTYFSFTGAITPILNSNSQSPYLIR